MKPRRRRRLARLAGALALTFGLVALSATALASVPLGSDFRISNVGTDADAARDGTNTAIAYNSTANEYLVTWEGDGLATDDEREIFGQRVSPAGAEIGSDFRISNVGTDNDATRDGTDPAVAYNSTANEYLVTWEGDGHATDDEVEIFGQRLSAAGAELGADFRISIMGTEGDASRDGISSAVAYNSTDNEYLVTWEGDGLPVSDYEVFGDRVSAAGAVIGPRFRISNMRADNTGGGFDSAIAYNPTANEYLVTWTGDGLGADDEFEIWGQRVSAAGTEAGADFRISNVGTDGDVTRAGIRSAVAYGVTANEYLATWSGDGLATDEEFEIFGQRVSATGTEAGTDFRISNVGTDGDATRDAGRPGVAYDSTANEYLVTFFGDALATDEEFEIFGQNVSAAGGEVGSDFRISTMGADGDAARSGRLAAVAYNPTATEYLVTWQGDGLATDEEFETFGRRVGIGTPPPIPPPPPPPPGPPDTVPPDPELSAPKGGKAKLAPKVTVKIVCGIEACIVEIDGIMKVTIAGRPTNAKPAKTKKYKLKSVTENVAANSEERVKLKLPKKGYKAAAEALDEGGKASLELTARATDETGNEDTDRTKLKLTP